MEVNVDRDFGWAPVAGEVEHEEVRAVFLAFGYEAEIGIETRHHGVLGGRTIFADQTLAAARPRQPRQHVERCLLDATAEHAAAHDPAIDVERLAGRAC